MNNTKTQRNEKKEENIHNNSKSGAVMFSYTTRYKVINLKNSVTIAAYQEKRIKFKDNSYCLALQVLP